MTVEEFDQNDRIDMVDVRRIIEIVTTLAGKGMVKNDISCIHELHVACFHVRLYANLSK